MSITNKKIDALRRLLLGELYQDCKDNPMGVSRKRLEEHIEKIKGEGCIGDCSVEEFVKTCQLKTHYPTCVSGDYRSCIEGIGERSRGADKARFEMYKKAKMIEDEPDEEEEESDENECNVCGLDGEDEKGEPVQEMSCGHHSHVNCLIKIAQQKGRNNAECPECRKEFSLTEVPVPVRTLEQRQEDSMRRARFNASQMGFDEEEEEEDNDEDEIEYESEDDDEEERLHQSILDNISAHNVDEAVREMTEYLGKFINNEKLQEWLTGIINIIPDVSIDDIISLIDTIPSTDITILQLNMRKLNDFLQNDQKDKAEYIIDNIIVSQIEINEEDTLIRILRTVISSGKEYLLKAILDAPTEEDDIEYLKSILDGLISSINIENQDIQRILSLWYVRNDFDEPEFLSESEDEEESDEEVNAVRRINFDDDEDDDDRPLQISRLTPPDQKVHRWFNRVRR